MGAIYSGGGTVRRGRWTGGVCVCGTGEVGEVAGQTRVSEKG